MLYRIRWVLLSTVLGAFFLLYPSDPALACSGVSSTTIDYLVENADIIAWGYVVESDQTRWNGLIEVQEYVSGGNNARFLKISQIGAGKVYSVRPDFFFGGRCAPGYQRLTISNERELFFLRYNIDGTYKLLSDNYISRFIFPTATTIIEMKRWNGYWEEFTRDTLLSFIRERRRVNFVLPADTLIPRPMPVLVLTENRSAYLLPVDSNTPKLIATDVLQWTEGDVYLGFITPMHLIAYNRLTGEQFSVPHPEDVDCLTFDCVAFSDHQVYVGLQYQSNRIVVCDLSLGTLPYNCGDHALYQFTGQAFQFSPTNESIAIWNGSTIEIHSIYFPGLGHNFEDELLAHIEIHLDTSTFDDSWFKGRAVWSPDGRRLAYADADGLWLWDVYDSTEATLLVPINGENVPYANEISSYGRFLHVIAGNEAYYFDLLTRMRILDGKISPDERALVAYDTLAESPASYERCYLTSMECQPIVDPDMSAYTDVKQVLWHRDHELLVLACSEIIPTCSINLYLQADYVRQVDFDLHTRIFLVQTGDFTLVTSDRRPINLAALIDSPIQEFHWLLPVYIDER